MGVAVGGKGDGILRDRTLIGPIEVEWIVNIYELGQSGLITFFIVLSASFCF